MEKERVHFSIDKENMDFLRFWNRTEKQSYSFLITKLILAERKKFGQDVSRYEHWLDENAAYYDCKKTWELVGFMERLTDRIHDFVQRHHAKNREIPFESLQLMIGKELRHAALYIPIEILEEHKRLITSFDRCATDIDYLKNYCHYIKAKEPNRFMKWEK